MVIGVTGSFGSGKTTITKMFAWLGAHTIDADKICHSLMTPSSKVYRRIVKHFGRCILKKNKTIDRKKLARVVFKEKAKGRLLNRLVHPEAIRKINKIIRLKKKKIIIIDAALLVETSFYKNMDKLIVVKTNKSTQINRLIHGKPFTKKEILERIRMQAPLKKKLELADFIIDNSGTKKETLIQVEKIWKTIRGEVCQ